MMVGERGDRDPRLRGVMIKKFLASFFQERRLFFCEGKKKNTFYHRWIGFASIRAIGTFAAIGRDFHLGCSGADASA
jgi:hypothetical protein